MSPRKPRKPRRIRIGDTVTTTTHTDKTCTVIDYFDPGDQSDRYNGRATDTRDERMLILRRHNDNMRIFRLEADCTWASPSNT